MVFGRSHLRIANRKGSVLPRESKVNGQTNSQCKLWFIQVENHQLEFPSDMSPVARDFIEQLVRKNPQERLKAS